jgi:tetratricopeptide (TPR) repeat protein
MATENDNISGRVFTTREIAKLAKLTPDRVRQCVQAGFLHPVRGSRGRFEYSLQDVLVLRSIRTLLEASLPPRRIAELLEEIRCRLPEGRDISSVNLRLQGERVVITYEGRRWLDTGQLLLGFQRPDQNSRIENLTPVEDDRAAYRAFTRGLELEKTSLPEAKVAYEEAIQLDHAAIPAYVNLGRLEHESGAFERAEALYQQALRLDGEERTALFNLAVLSEDQGDASKALRRYSQLLVADPQNIDGHHCLARLHARLGNQAESRRYTRLCREILRGR